MPNDRMLSLLGLARRAGKVQMGHDPVLESLRRGRARLVVLASDLSPHTAKGILCAARQEEIPIYTLSHSMEELSAAVGKHTGAVAVEDSGFARKLETFCTDR